MKFSIVTVVRNAADTIGDTLRSVAAQTYRDREHVVADGGSTDGTLEILEAEASRLGALQSKPDKGIYDGFNNGLALASGDVVAFLNADDFYEDERVLEDVERTFRETGADVVFGDVVLVRAGDLRDVVRFYRSGNFTRERLSRGFMPAHPSMFVRRALFERFGGFDTRYRIAGDFAWTAKVLGHPDVSFAYLPRVMVRMRHGGASTQGIRSTIRITREIRLACREAGIPTSYPRLLTRFPEKVMEYWKRPAACEPASTAGRVALK
jgi:glycosyltransferase involved in cell wall biosynthesis